MRTKPKKKARTFKGWIIMEGASPATFDYRMPVYWRKNPAMVDANEKCFEHSIESVTITITERKRGK